MNPYVHPLQSTTRLTLTQFLQTVLVGLTGIDGSLVRPRWQPEPPKQPDIKTNWLALGIESSRPDFNAYLSSPVNSTTPITTQRHEDLTLAISIYGPDNLEVYGLIRDGIQIPQNRFALSQANMGYTDISEARRIPDLVNERWVDRVECTLLLKREIQRTYPVLTFVSASGIIYVPDVNADYQLPWEVPQ